MKTKLTFFFIVLLCPLLAFTQGLEPSILDGCEESLSFVEANLPLVPVHIRAQTCRRVGPPAGVDLSSYAGPNCFMGVMLWFHPQEPLRFVGGEEFEKFLEGFVPIEREELRYGDVVIFEREDLRDMSGQRWISHAAIFIGEDIVWNKLGPSKNWFNGEQTVFMEPNWTFSNLSALEAEHEIATMKFYRRR
jgi:hypothetical protein